MSARAAAPKITRGIWWRDGMAGVEHLAATNRAFTCYDLAKLGVPEPDRPQHWALLMAEAHRKGLIKPDGRTASPRPASRHTAVTSWIGARGRRPQ